MRVTTQGRAENPQITQISPIRNLRESAQPANLFFHTVIVPSVTGTPLTVCATLPTVTEAD